MREILCFLTPISTAGEDATKCSGGLESKVRAPDDHDGTDGMREATPRQRPQLPPTLPPLGRVPSVMGLDESEGGWRPKGHGVAAGRS